MSTWVLLRGLVREARHWGDFSEQLQRAFPGDAFALLDLPGNGRLCRESSPAAISEMTDHCRSSLNLLGCPTPYRLLALSLGGMVGTDWVSRYPNEVSQAIFINTSLRPHSPFYHRLHPHNYGRILRMLTVAEVEARERSILDITSNHDRSKLVPLWSAYQRELPVSRINAIRQLIAAIRYRAPTLPSHPPILLLNSLGDRLVDPVCSQRLAEVWQRPLKTHPDAGHDLPLDDPRWVVETIAHWLK